MEIFLERRFSLFGNSGSILTVLVFKSSILLTKTSFESRHEKQTAGSMTFDTKSKKVEAFANSPRNRKSSRDYIIVQEHGARAAGLEGFHKHIL